MADGPTTRRAVLTTGAAILATAPAAARAKTAEKAFDIVVFDSRYPESRRFAAVMAKSGATPLDVGEEIGDLWFGPLARLDAKTRVCGLTTHADFFISSSFGREKGKALRYEGQHDARAPGEVTHQIGCTATAASLEGCGRDWAGSLAQGLLKSDATRTRKAKAKVRTARPPKAAATLFSWVLA